MPRRSLYHSLTHLSVTEKYVLALRSLNAALALEPENGTVHEQVVRLRHALNSEKLATLPAKTAEVLRAEFTAVTPTTDLKTFNADFRARHAGSAAHIISAIKTARFLAETDDAAGDADVHAKYLLTVLDIPDVQHDQAEECLGLLRQWRCVDDAEAFKGKAHEKWPEVTSFA